MYIIDSQKQRVYSSPYNAKFLQFISFFSLLAKIPPLKFEIPPLGTSTSHLRITFLSISLPPSLLSTPLSLPNKHIIALSPISTQSRSFAHCCKIYDFARNLNLWTDCFVRNRFIFGKYLYKLMCIFNNVYWYWSAHLPLLSMDQKMQGNECNFLLFPCV